MPKKRKQSQRQYKKQIFIVCEGKKTEPNYFNGFKKLCDLDRAVNVKIVSHEHTSAKELVEDVLKFKETENDELWVVFDKDGYTKHHEAFCKAKDNGVNIAFSSISFEYWLLLHFEYTSSSFQKSKNVEHALKKHLPDYEKKWTEIFEKVSHLIQDAIIHAKRRKKEVGTANYDDCKIYKLNPYTNVDELLHAIENLRSEYQRDPVFLFKY